MTREVITCVARVSCVRRYTLVKRSISIVVGREPLNESCVFHFSRFFIGLSLRTNLWEEYCWEPWDRALLFTISPEYSPERVRKVRRCIKVSFCRHTLRLAHNMPVLPGDLYEKPCRLGSLQHNSEVQSVTNRSENMVKYPIWLYTTDLSPSTWMRNYRTIMSSSFN